MYPKTVLLIAALAPMASALPVEGLDERQIITQQAACCRDHIVLQDARSIGFDCIRPPNPAMGKFAYFIAKFSMSKANTLSRLCWCRRKGPCYCL